jgi:serine protease Do
MNFKKLQMKKWMLGITAMLLVSTSLIAQEVIIIKKTNKDSLNKPLMVIDGVINDNANMDDMSPTDIASINVIKGKNATSKYGDKGENGVVEIFTKKAPKVVKIDTSINMTVLVDGDNVTINGVPVDKNDPRITKKGRVIISKGNAFKPKNKGGVDSTKATIEFENYEDMLAPATASNKAFLGVMTEVADQEKGAVIKTVSDDSPAKKAGLKENDIITKINDQPIDGPKSLYEAVGKFQPDEKINITIIRDGKEKKINATLAKNKAQEENNVLFFNSPDGNMPNIMRRGFQFVPGQNFEMPTLPGLNGIINSMDKKPKLGISIEDLETGEGVKIKTVTTASPAEKAGLKVNDIITKMDDKVVKEVTDLKWEYLKEGQNLKFTILRNGEQKSIDVKIPKKLKTADL